MNHIQEVANRLQGLRDALDLSVEEFAAHIFSFLSNIYYSKQNSRHTKCIDCSRYMEVIYDYFTCFNETTPLAVVTLIT